ncbi:MAG TPA: ABC transporter permease [Solirubrobacteraceae bacterium]|nr:ABC transporter permease [Solirubrobacteraceae bacterium]
MSATERRALERDSDSPPRGASTLAGAGEGATRAVAQRFLARYALVVAFAAVVAGFSLADPGVFLTVRNAQTIGATQAVTAIMALAALLPLVAGQFDLSIGSQLAVTQAVCAVLIIQHHVPAGPAALVTVLVGAVYGLINGLLVVRVRINAFIATLGSGTIGLGVMQWLTQGQEVFGPVPSSFLRLGRNDLAGVPLPFVYVLVIAVVLWVGLEYTRSGRTAFATGGNARAALLAGVNVERTTLGAFVGAGCLSGVAGVLSVMILGAAHPDVGTGFLLPAFAGAFLGATSIRPGRFNVWGTVIAIYFLAAGITGLQQQGAAFYVQQYFDGGALLFAVALSQAAATRRRRRVEA